MLREDSLLEMALSKQSGYEYKQSTANWMGWKNIKVFVSLFI